MLQRAFLSIAATGIKEAKIRAKLSRSHTGQGPCARQSVRLRRCFLRRAVLGVAPHDSLPFGRRPTSRRALPSPFAVRLRRAPGHVG
jgi:hypothetical protein